MSLGSMFKRIMAGNPFYLASAGLLLHGINQLTTDSKLVGSGFPMLRFNFCALFLYEIMLVGTAILLIRRKIWYDALLLFGLTNLFVIVPFSLISRAVFLSSHLALTMSICGAALAVAKFWAFKRYARELNLPGRLLFFGAILLLVNASAPLLFKIIEYDLDRISRWLTFIWEFALPALAGLGIFLPRPSGQTGRSALPISGNASAGGPAALPYQWRSALSISGSASGDEKWLPAAVFFGWVIVTAFHFGGIGYSNSYVWNYSLLVPIAWVMAWTAYVRITDFVTVPSRLVEQICVSAPLLLPLLAVGRENIFLLFAGLNLAIYGVLLTGKDRNFLALTRFVGAVAILAGGLPLGWINHIVPGIEQPEWAVLSVGVCFFGLIFRFRDPRIAMLGALGLIGLSCTFAAPLSHSAVQVALVSLLVRSLRWDDKAHRGAATLRILAAILWVWVSCFWLFGSDCPERLLVYSAAGALLGIYLLRATSARCWNRPIVPISASFVLLSEPATILGGWLDRKTPGMLAVVGSFLLFALGSVAAFSKPKWWRPG